MTERRRAERFDLADPGVGSLRLVHDVQIERVGPREAVVIAPAPLPRGEQLLLEIPLQRQTAPPTFLVRVIHNRVVMDDGSLRRRVRLELLDQSGEAERTAAEFKRQRRGRRAVVGAIIRRVPVRVVEASTGGCAMECPSIIVEGTVGFVQVRTQRQGHSEAVRINRTVQVLNGVWRYRMAAEFLTLGPASPESLRGVATVMTTSTLQIPPLDDARPSTLLVAKGRGGE